MVSSGQVSHESWFPSEYVPSAQATGASSAEAHEDPGGHCLHDSDPVEVVYEPELQTEHAVFTGNPPPVEDLKRPMGQGSGAAVFPAHAWPAGQVSQDAVHSTKYSPAVQSLATSARVGAVKIPTHATSKMMTTTTSILFPSRRWSTFGRDFPMLRGSVYVSDCGVWRWSQRGGWVGDTRRSGGR